MRRLAAIALSVAAICGVGAFLSVHGLHPIYETRVSVGVNDPSGPELMERAAGTRTVADPDAPYLLSGRAGLREAARRAGLSDAETASLVVRDSADLPPSFDIDPERDRRIFFAVRASTGRRAAAAASSLASSYVALRKQQVRGLLSGAADALRLRADLEAQDRLILRRRAASIETLERLEAARLSPKAAVVSAPARLSPNVARDTALASLGGVLLVVSLGVTRRALRRRDGD